MRFLITGSDTVPGRNILEALQRQGFDCVGLSSEWPMLADAGRILSDANPEIIINAHEFSGIDRCEEDPDSCLFHNFEVVKQLSTHAAEQQAALIHLSTCYVFDGSKKSPYKSANRGNPLSAFGRAKWQAEQCAREMVTRSVVLRLGWLIGPEPSNLLERLVQAKWDQRPVEVSDAHRGNPTAPEDVARVVVAMVRQLLCDAPVWGAYHYAGAEVVSQRAFARAIAEHFMDAREVVELIQSASAQQLDSMKEPLNASLGCIKIRNTFGIKQKPWRNYLGEIVRETMQPALADRQSSNTSAKLSVSS